MSYHREKAVAYARKWALGRNPRYYNFSGIGGDCANFASQCLLAGGAVMNYRPLFGWYYRSANDRTPSWSGVKYLYNYLVGNQDVGPHALETSIEKILPGDLIQLATYLPEFHHTLIVTGTGLPLTYENVRVCAHSYDSFDRALSSYPIQKIRFLHIVDSEH